MIPGSRYTEQQASYPAKNLKPNRLFNTALIVLAFALTCLFIAFGVGSSTEQDAMFEIGQPSTVSILAPRRIYNELATERNREEAERVADILGDVTFTDPQTWPLEVESPLNILAENLDSIREFHAQEVTDFESARLAADAAFYAHMLRFNAEMEAWEELQTLYNEGDTDIELPPQPEQPQRADAEPFESQVWEQFDLLSDGLTATQRELIVHMDEYYYAQLWEIIMDVAYTIQATDIEEITVITLNAVREHLGTWALDQHSRDIAFEIVTRHLVPNQIIDVEATQNRWEATASIYVEEYVLPGQTIVNVGQIVTEDIYHMLEQLGMLGEVTIGDLAVSVGGAFIIVALLFFACILYLTFYRPTIATNRREAFLLFTLYVLVLTFVSLLGNVAYPFLPLLIFPMLVSVLIERRSAVILSFSMTLACYFIVDGSWDFLFFFLVAGLLVTMLSRFTTDRNKIFLVGFAVSMLQFGLAIAVAFVVDIHQALESIPDLITIASFAALNGLLTVIISTGSLPIWETFFCVVTPVKLLDLTNPTNILLRRLTIEAPGTYHHSLIVANLAESAAYDIGANAHAARVGGYYHDIGKLKNPHYFAENLDKDNPHDHLDPIDSAQIIIGHVTYGLSLAAEHRLPQFVRDIIQEHHGNSLLQFFYHKAQETEEQVDDKNYRYPYSIPETRESACVMLADITEAAVRSMMSKIKTPNELEKIIKDLIRNKLNDGQLENSQLSIRDIAVIEQSFMRVLKGMYHERIPYPKLVPVEDAESVIEASS